MSAPKEVQIIVRGGMVECVHNWPDGLPGAVYDYDDEYDPAEKPRIPIRDLIEGGDTSSPDYVLIKIETAEWLIEELEPVARAARDCGNLSNARYLGQLSVVAFDLGFEKEGADWATEANRMSAALRAG